LYYLTCILLFTAPLTIGGAIANPDDMMIYDDDRLVFSIVLFWILHKNYWLKETSTVVYCGSVTAVYAQSRRCMCSHQMAALFLRNNVMAAILNIWGHITNWTLSIDAYLAEQHSCRVLSPLWF